MNINLSGLVLLTGVPGAGKTLRMMEYLEAALAEGRPCYVCNVNGLNVAGAMPYDDPHQWRDLPPNAVLFVDEAQRYFRSRRGMTDPPKSITDMETIRHDGVCIVMTTQRPTYLDKHVRGLIGTHEHLVEMVAGKVSNVYRFRACRDDLSDSDLAVAEYEVWSHPKRLHGRYKSAEVHTKKVKLPLRVKLVAAAVVLFLAWVGVGFIHKSEPEPGRAQAPLGAGPARVAAAPADGKPPISPLEWAQRNQPRLASLPISAPIFDGRQAQSNPEVYCMSSEAGIDGQGQYQAASVTCLTEQGTRYRLDPAMARYVARNGAAYNPFKAPEQVQQEQPPESAQAAPAGDVAAPVAGGTIARQPRTLGTFPESPSYPAQSVTPPTTLDM